MPALAKEMVYPPTEAFEPGPAIAAVAASRGWPLAGIDPVESRVRPEVGDRCVVLISMRDGQEVEQWLARFEVVTGSAEEQRDLAAAARAPFELHTSSGGKYTFAQEIGRAHV